MMEMDIFKLKLDIYRDYDLREAVNRMSPGEWWVMLDYKTGQRNPLARIAIRVLSQTTSSSQCERNWSTFSLIHTKVRNMFSVTRLEKLVYCHYNMRLKVKCIRERQKRSKARLMTFAGSHWEQRFAEREALSPPIDVDELLDEEHPLNAWVETRQKRDVPEFDPRDCSWADGELDGVEARDPEFRVSEDPPLFPQPRHSAILPETSRVPPTQPALRRAATQKERSSKAIELEKRTYTRQKKRKVQQPICSDDTTQDPNDDDDGAAIGAT
ncbi:hypothetical protein Taro_017223 [Colocasia esculenta]|uniref:HAT C-terminal dimerisation domain-containing protein n=1 Tax=Colocasia esculenta TaxID=4460 RepID=A0A843UVC7_COLES|nr:hypothetical protein [Colocasia esculenta]